MYFYTLLPLKPTQGDHNGKVLNKSSKISGFYKLSPEERLEIVTIYSGLTEEDPAYKNVDMVADVSDKVGIATKVARLVPLAVVKG